MWIYILVGGVAISIITLGFIIDGLRRKEREHNDKGVPKSILIVIGSGGHTREMMPLVKALGGNYQPRFYVIASTDTTSKDKVIEWEKGYNIPHAFHTIPRSREVKQSYLTSVFSTLTAIFASVPLVFRLRPDIILCNGPGSCIPICLGGLLLRWLFIKRTMIVYVESICRVKSLSVSGKLLYHFADSLFVQWPELNARYPKTKYLGRLVE